MERRTQGIRERDWQDIQAGRGGPHRPTAVMAEPQDEAELLAVLDELGTSLEGGKPGSPQLQRTKVGPSVWIACLKAYNRLLACLLACLQ